MKWVTYLDADGERTGVLAGDAIYAMPAGVTLLDLIGRGADGLRAAGEKALRAPAATVPLGEVRLLAPIPHPPSIRDSLCFLDHMRNCQAAMGAGRTLADTWYRIPAFYFACPATVSGPYDDAPTAPGSAWQDFELEIAAVIGPGGRDLSVDEAERAIIGYTIFNDWSARDLQQHGEPTGDRAGQGQRQRRHTGPLSGDARRARAVPAPLRSGRLDLRVTALVNDAVIGSGSTANGLDLWRSRSPTPRAA